ncbi:MAG: TetR/AcrR family transcriptional regulator [Herpetosiphon sp.]
MDTLDRRIKRTQRALAEALIALTLQNGYEAVTIRDITERADVGYATFFRHYQDKDALLGDVSDVVVDELVQLLKLETSATDPAAMGTLIFQYVRDHSAICRVLLGSRGAAAVVERVTVASTDNILRLHKPMLGSSVPPEVAANHLVGASLTLIRWWLDHGMPYSPERMGAIYGDLIMIPTQSLAFQGINS